ncbi:MAG: glycoside hydrolase family 9 protein [Treponema sp.]|nr:glycoside hydrolase family 9 protein [Treponema sp.]
MENKFKLNNKGQYFECGGVSVMGFSDFYPAGHQSGIGIIMNGKRVATNGDIRFEPTPGQWQPVPKQLKREIIKFEGKDAIKTRLAYPDKNAHLKGFNPIVYPDFEFEYDITLSAEGSGLVVQVDLDKEIPAKYKGKLFFNMELYPAELFGKPWLMDNKQGIFPRQPNGPVFERESNYKNAGHFADTEEHTSAEILSNNQKEYSPIVADDILGIPYACGHKFTSRPEDSLSRFTVESETELKLYDGRMNHNNGWFVLSSELPLSKTKNALVCKITPYVDENWRYSPVVQVSQVGYHSIQNKVAVIETDKRDENSYEAILLRHTAEGPVEVVKKTCRVWGEFLRYKYYHFDFSEIKEEGLYQVKVGTETSAIFQISDEVYDRGVWQPVLEYFLPIQMCHMRVSEKYRVWHGHCHADDARMAPVNRGHFDGYFQGPETMIKYKPGDCVPGLNKGGWHDAGDFDLRVESQSGESYILSLAYEAFGVNYDATTIDQENHLVEIHQADGKNDILQQIEHGALSVVGGYKAMDRLYRGIICNNLRQYVLLGDAAAMTKGITGDEDDRWVFTEDNPAREFSTAAHLAAVYRALKGFNDQLSKDSLFVATELFERTRLEENDWCRKNRIQAAAELYISTADEKYKKVLSEESDYILKNASNVGWMAVRAIKAFDSAFIEKLKGALIQSKKELEEKSSENPYGVPYHPVIYGAGWGIQGMAFNYYWIHKAFPEIYGKDLLEKILNFILGCHPGLNTASFASGVGARSMTTAYGINRADWSYVPGGVVSGTALIQPDFPELLDFPFLWQQAEYVLGGGSSNFMFLVLAVRQLLGRDF